MATGKKSFLLYCDLIHTFNELSNEEAGELIKHIFSYVNDENPTTENKLIKIAFEPIKQQLKRDLKNWEIMIHKKSEAGKASAEKRKQLSTPVESVEQEPTKPTVNVTVNDTVTVIEKENRRKRAVFIPPILSDVKAYFLENGYTEHSAERAFKHYDVADWYDANGNKVKNWKQKMSTNWFKDENLIVKKQGMTVSAMESYLRNKVN